MSFVSPSTLNVSLGFASGNIEVSGKQKTQCFPWGQSLSAYYTTHWSFEFYVQSLNGGQLFIFGVFILRWLKTFPSTFQQLNFEINTTTLYWKMLQYRYHINSQSSVTDKLWPLLWHNRLPQQQYNLLRTPSTLALTVYITPKRLGETHSLIIATSTWRYICLKSLKNSIGRT